MVFNSGSCDIMYYSEVLWKETEKQKQDLVSKKQNQRN